MKKNLFYFLVFIYFTSGSPSLASEHASKEKVFNDKNEKIDIKIKMLNGANFDLGKSKNKLTIINFWAYWCGICKNELKILEDIHRKYSSKNVEIIGISIDEKSKMSKILKILQNTSFKNGLFEDAKITITKAGAIKNLEEPNSIPRTYFINSQQEIIGIYKGELEFDEIEEIIKKNENS